MLSTWPNQPSTHIFEPRIVLEAAWILWVITKPVELSSLRFLLVCYFFPTIKSFYTLDLAFVSTLTASVHDVMYSPLRAFLLRITTGIYFVFLPICFLRLSKWITPRVCGIFWGQKAEHVSCIRLVKRVQKRNTPPYLWLEGVLVCSGFHDPRKQHRPGGLWNTNIYFLESLRLEVWD